MSTEDRLDAAVAEFLQACEAGPPPDRAAFLARHADVADGLRRFFADHDRFANAIQQASELTATHPGGEDSDDPRQVPAQPPGQRVGDYVLMGELARGAMGVVYRAREVGSGRVVALKMILTGALAAGEETRRFRDEAENAAGLEHPNITPIYHVGEWQPPGGTAVPYYTMKLVEGGSLKDRAADLKGKHREVARLMALVARALDHAHRRGVLHRDLKPANVLVDQEGVPYLTDFGLAKRLNAHDREATQTGTAVGTPSYMSPEQARGEKLLTTAADVYGLGAILYALLTGRPPFAGPTVHDTLRLVVESAPAPPRKYEPAVPRDLETICLKCLEKEPARRYVSARLLAEDLERWLNGEVIRARPVGPLERVAVWARRNPAAATLTVAAAVLLVGESAAAVALARGSERDLRQRTAGDNAYAATHVANTVLARFNRLSEPLLAMADDVNLPAWIEAGDAAALEALCEATRRGARNEYVTVFVQDPRGDIIAEAPKRVAGKPVAFPTRDYFMGALRRAKEAAKNPRHGSRNVVHVGRVYHSQNDDRQKFSLSVPITGGGLPGLPDPNLRGVLVASIMAQDITRGLATLHDRDRRRITAVVGPFDAHPPAGPDPEWVVLSHPGYLDGEVPLHFPAALPRPRTDPDAPELEPPPKQAALPPSDDYTDPLSRHLGRTEFAGRWLAGFAPVGNTEYLVVVQQREHRDPTPWLMVMMLLGLVLFVTAAWLGLTRGRRGA